VDCSENRAWLELLWEGDVEGEKEEVRDSLSEVVRVGVTGVEIEAVGDGVVGGVEVGVIDGAPPLGEEVIEAWEGVADSESRVVNEEDTEGEGDSEA